jgi:hypothetical protein
MKKFIVLAIATALTVTAFAKPGDCKKCTEKHCTTECRAKCAKGKCAPGQCN